MSNLSRLAYLCKGQVYRFYLAVKCHCVAVIVILVEPATFETVFPYAEGILVFINKNIL